MIIPFCCVLWRTELTYFHSVIRFLIVFIHHSKRTLFISLHIFGNLSVKTFWLFFFYLIRKSRKVQSKIIDQKILYFIVYKKQNKKHPCFSTKMSPRCHWENWTDRLIIYTILAVVIFTVTYTILFFYSIYSSNNMAFFSSRETS